MLTQMEEKFASWTEFEHEMQILLRPKCLNKMAYERMFQANKNLSFEYGLPELAMRQQFFD